MNPPPFPLPLFPPPLLPGFPQINQSIQNIQILEHHPDPMLQVPTHPSQPLLTLKYSGINSQVPPSPRKVKYAAALVQSFCKSRSQTSTRNMGGEGGGRTGYRLDLLPFHLVYRYSESIPSPPPSPLSATGKHNPRRTNSV